MELKNATCLVTGSSRGIGRALVLELADRGAAVWAGSRDPAALSDISQEGVHPIELDVTDRESVEAAVATLGDVDLLINNAGYGVEGAIEEVEDDDLLEQFEVNVFGTWRLCRAVLPSMRARACGTIVNISSFGGQAPFPGIGAYRSSKFAVEGLTWTLHLEVAHFGIRVLSVQPGSTASDFDESMRRARGFDEEGPYAAMREVAARAYPVMSPTAMTSEHVARLTVDEVSRPEGPLHLRLGADAHWMTSSITAGDEEYERLLVEDLGFDWHPRRRL